MDSVPFKFCDTVASLLDELPNVDDRPPGSSLWWTAFHEHKENRKPVLLRLALNDTMSFIFHDIDNFLNYSLAQLQAMDRRYIRITEIEIVNVINSKSSVITFQELEALLQYLKIYIKNPVIYIAKAVERRQDELKKVLLLFDDIELCEIDTRLSSNYIQRFVTNRLKSGSISYLYLSNTADWKTEYEDEVDQFMLTGDYDHISTEKTYDMQFLEKLFESPLTGMRKSVTLCFTPHLTNGLFEKQTQKWKTNSSVGFRRADGVQVRIDLSAPHCQHQISFERKLL
ncbi:hypothetical protein QR680_004298 [Steinernema hermaphroditum]|uniref:Uncharacterized protein n=1 Tax=Steinernema hermaphroditum TaxID=289476 RepID=A0AA39LTS5_9BILA|nr:hypothetical protein QR680_004298 [Steinernema hermaphroditum]